MSRISELASIISENTAIVESFFQARGLPFPSYDINGPSAITIPPNEKASAAHVAVLSATMELHNLMLGPKAVLMSQNRVDNLSLHGTYRFQLDKAFPVGSEASFEEISQVSGLDLIDTRRILRHAMTNGIFCEPRPGIVAHTAASRLLVENCAVRDFVGVSVEEATPAHAKTINAISKWGYAKDCSQSGFSLAHNTSKGLYDELCDYPERGRRWANSMTLYATTVPIDGILRSFNWETIENGPVVDVGGGHGPVSVSLAQRLPGLKFIVQDLEHVVSEGPSLIPPELTDRISFMAYDIRKQQPVSNAPVYFFRAVFHNWPDATCIEILRNQIPALRPGAKIITQDPIMHKPGTLPLYLEKRRRTMDLNMLTYFGSRERTQQDWQEIAKEAHGHFQVDFPAPVAGEANMVMILTWKG